MATSTPDASASGMQTPIAPIQPHGHPAPAPTPAAPLLVALPIHAPAILQQVHATGFAGQQQPAASSPRLAMAPAGAIAIASPDDGKGPFAASPGQARECETESETDNEDEDTRQLAHAGLGAPVTCPEEDLASSGPEGTSRLQQQARVPGEEKVCAEQADNAEHCNRMGWELHSQRKLGEALTYHRRALAIVEQTLGSDHPDAADHLNCIAMVLSDQGDFDGALVSFLKALAIRQNALGHAHAKTAESCEFIGVMLRGRGLCEDALACHREALAIRKNVPGADPEMSPSPIAA